MRRRWRLTIIVRAAHARDGVLIQLGLNSIKDPVDTRGHPSDQSLWDCALFPAAHFCHHQIDYVTTPIFALLRKPLLHSLRDPQIEPSD